MKQYPFLDGWRTGIHIPSVEETTLCLTLLGSWCLSVSTETLFPLQECVCGNTSGIGIWYLFWAQTSLWTSVQTHSILTCWLMWKSRHWGLEMPDMCFFFGRIYQRLQPIPTYKRHICVLLWYMLCASQWYSTSSPVCSRNILIFSLLQSMWKLVRKGQGNGSVARSAV